MIATISEPIVEEVLTPKPITVPSGIDLIQEHIRQIAEWMLEGYAKGYPQATGMLLNAHPTLGGRIALCALGMAMAGSHPELKACSLPRVFSGPSSRDLLGEARGALAVWVKHPRTEKEVSLEIAVTSLNDLHDWSVPQIAAFLFSLEYDPERKIWQAGAGEML